MYEARRSAVASTIVAQSRGRKRNVRRHVSDSGATGNDRRSGYALDPRKTFMMRLPWERLLYERH